MVVTIYSDSSYSPSYDIAVVGYRFDSDEIQTMTLTKVGGCAQAEKRAVTFAIHQAPPSEHIVVYTDHKAIVDRPDRLGIDTSHIEFRFISGHTKKADRSKEQQLFAEVDQQVRKLLRITTRQLK
jgi:hypothetical protein